MAVQRDQARELRERVLLAGCVAAVALLVGCAVSMGSLLVVVARLWPPDAFSVPLVSAGGALLGCMATIPMFLSTRPRHRWPGSIGIVLAFAIPWCVDQGFHPALPAALAAVTRLAIPTRPDPALLSRAI